VILPGTLRTRSLLRATPWQRAHTTTATTGEAPRWGQARATKATATATAGEAPRGNDEHRDNNGNGYVQGEGNCGGGGSGDGGGDNGNDDNGGGDKDNEGIDDNDDGGDDKDDEVSDDDHNGGNGGDGGGGCNTATAVGIDRQVNNQLKAAIDTGRGRPRGGGRGHGQRRHGLPKLKDSILR
jgi:hypothetical protein